MQACLSEENWNFLEYYFGWNSSAAHPETILYCCVMSKFSNNDMRLEALQFIERARHRRLNNPTQNVRLFKYPTQDMINFEADTIMELLNLTEIEANNPEYITEPPLLMDLALEELREIHQNCVETGTYPLKYLCDETLNGGDQNFLTLGKNLASLKCHSIWNEKAVQMTTRAVKKHIGHDKQSGAIIVTKDSVDQTPITSNKSHFCKKLDFD